MSSLAPGTVCYLVGHVGMPELNGRVVEVQRRVPDDEQVYQVAAPWLQHVFPGCEVHTTLRNLLPIVPPEITPPAVRKRARLPA